MKNEASWHARKYCRRLPSWPRIVLPRHKLRRGNHRASLLLSGNVSLLRLQFASDLFVLLHHIQQIAAENLANVVVGIALTHQRLGDFWQLSTVVHALGHAG